MTLAIILLILLVWVLWLTSKPGRVPLICEADREQLASRLDNRSIQDNQIETYPDFRQMVQQLLEDIEEAEQFIHVQFFKFEGDVVGQSIGNALAKKAKEGVEVRLLYDDLANLKSKWYYRKLQEQGIEVCGFGPTHSPFLRKKDNYRNHRKVVVIDGKKGYLGGMNIADRYYQGLSWGEWRDTQIRIQGPAVAQLQQAFLSDWRYASGTLLASPHYFPKVESMGEIPVRVITSGPIGDGPTIMKEFCRMVDESQHYVYWESPYFIPTKEVMRSICNAARRGVDVRIILPPKGDRGIMTPLASKSYMQEALGAGVHIYFYQKGYMHSKIMVCDDCKATVGSTNIDPRSYLLDMEINAFIESIEYAKEIKKIFLADEKESELITPKKWSERPICHHIEERLARLFSAQL